jgi:hypothetical protein
VRNGTGQTADAPASSYRVCIPHGSWEKTRPGSNHSKGGTRHEATKGQSEPGLRGVLLPLPGEDWVAGSAVCVPHTTKASVVPARRFGWQFARWVIWIRAGQARRWRVGPQPARSGGDKDFRGSTERLPRLPPNLTDDVAEGREAVEFPPVVASRRSGR